MIYMKFVKLENFGEIVQAVSTRKEGMSEDGYETLNLAFHTGDNPDKVLINRELMCNRLNIPLDCLVTAKQVHGTNVAVIKKDGWGQGSEDYESAVEATDAMITGAPQIYLMVLIADCCAVVYYDPVKKVVGVVHAGWRSSLGGISGKVVEKMKEAFKSKPENIICGIAPSMGPCCCEVGEDVAKSFAGQGFSPANNCIETRDGKSFLNLWEINRRQLIDSGIKDENIEVARLCNSCHTDLFYSFRKEDKTGRYAVLIGRRE